MDYQVGDRVRIEKDGTGEFFNWIGVIVGTMEDFVPGIVYAVAFREQSNGSIPVTAGFLGFFRKWGAWFESGELRLAP